MDQKQREQLILILLPTMLVGLVYLLFFLRGQQRSHAALQQQLQQARDGTSSDEELMVAKTRADAAQRKCSELQNNIAERTARLEQAAGYFGEDRKQFTLFGQLAELMDEHQLVLVSQTVTDKLKMPKHQQQMLDNIDKWNGERELNFCEFEFQGRFADVQKLLADLERSDIAALPLSIDLKPSEDDGLHRWTLVMAM